MSCIFDGTGKITFPVFSAPGEFTITGNFTYNSNRRIVLGDIGESKDFIGNEDAVGQSVRANINGNVIVLTIPGLVEDDVVNFTLSRVGTTITFSANGQSDTLTNTSDFRVDNFGSFNIDADSSKYTGQISGIWTFDNGVEQARSYDFDNSTGTQLDDTGLGAFHGTLTGFTTGGFPVPNDPPIANAGPDQANVLQRSTVTLDFSGSSDPDGTIDTYSVTQTAGTPVTLSAPTADTRTFVAPANEILTFELTVTDDGGATATDTVTITTLANQPPVANAGPDQSNVLQGDTVVLDFGESYDPDGSIATYSLTQTAGPNTPFTVDSETTRSFVASGDSTLEFTLTVTDDDGATDTDVVVVTTVVNAVPVANAGQDLLKRGAGQIVTLDSSLSSDRNGTISSRLWEQLSGDPVTLSDAAAIKPEFTTPSTGVAQNLVFQLTVTDNDGATHTDTVTVGVEPFKPALTNLNGFKIIEKNNNGTEVINGLTLSKFSNPDGDVFGYGLREEEIIEATDLDFTSNTSTGVIQIATLTVPGDLAYVADKTRIQIEVTLDSFVEVEMHLLFNEFRNSAQNRFTSLYDGTLSLKMNFDIIPLEGDYFRLDAIDEFMPQQLKYSHRHQDAPITGDLSMPIFLQFSSDSGSVNVTSINATATVGASQYNKDGKFFRGKDRADIVPFEENDQYNQLLPTNLVTPKYACTYDSANEAGAHMVITSGSDLITVADTSEVLVGQAVFICFGYVTDYATNQPFTLGGETFEASEDETIQYLGIQQFVEEIVDATTIRVTYPALASYSSPAVDFAKRTFFIGTFDPEHGSFIFGQDQSSWVNSVVTGISRNDTRANSYRGLIQLHYISETDPVVRFNFDKMLTTQANTLDLKGFTIISFGNSYSTGYFEIPIPDSFNNSYDQNANFDRTVVFITPCKRYSIETIFTGTHDAPGKDANGHYNCARVSVTPLFGSSVPKIWDRPELADKGMSNSNRASSLSLIGGIIRKEELDTITNGIGGIASTIDADLDIAESAIPHALIMLICTSQLQSREYLADRTDPNSSSIFYSLTGYVNRPAIVSGGSGYAVNDVIYLDGDALTKARVTVTQVDGSGAVLSIFVTGTGQYYTNAASANHTTTTSGVGTGATFNTVGELIEVRNNLSMQAVTYPASVIDPNAATQRGSGCNTLGSVFTIDPNIDIRAEWRSRMLEDYAEFGYLRQRNSFEFYAVLSAIKKYGTRVGDVATSSLSLMVIDHRATATQQDNLVDFREGGFFNLRMLRYMLVPVQNFTPFNNITNTKPVIKLIGGSPSSVDQNSTFDDLGAYAFDDIEGDISSRIIAAGTVDTTTLGDYPRTYNVADLKGQSADEVNRTYSVEEVVAAPLTGSFPAQRIEGERATRLTATVTGGSGNYTYSWSYVTGGIVSFDDPTLPNPTAIFEWDPVSTRTVLRIVVSDGTETITKTKDITITQPNLTTGVVLNVTDIPDGVYTVDFQYTETGELIVRKSVTFAGGTASTSLPVLNGTSVDYVIKTSTHMAGDTGVAS